MILIILLSPYIQFWIGFTLIIFSFIGIIVYWAVKHKQFSDQGRARYLPLEDDDIPMNEEQKKKNESKT